MCTKPAFLSFLFTSAKSPMVAPPPIHCTTSGLSWKTKAPDSCAAMCRWSCWSRDDVDARERHDTQNSFSKSCIPLTEMMIEGCASLIFGSALTTTIKKQITYVYAPDFVWPAQFKNSIRWLPAYLSIKTVITGGMRCYWWQNQLKRHHCMKKTTIPKPAPRRPENKDAEY